MSKKPVVHIEQWSITNGVLVGIALDHPKFPPASEIYSTGIIKDANPTYVETKNSLYILGEPQRPKVAPLTAIQNQALAVVKKALLGGANSGPLAEIFRKEVEEGANSAAQAAIRALIDAKLLVQ